MFPQICGAFYKVSDSVRGGLAGRYRYTGRLGSFSGRYFPAARVHLL